MKRKLVVALAIISLLMLVSCSPTVSPSQDTGLSEEATLRLEDLNFICNNLEEEHKNLYANLSKNEFQNEKQKIIDKISDLTESEFYYELKHLIAQVGDAHTNIVYSDSQYKHLNALGFAISKFEDGWHLMMLEEKNQKYLGYELVTINDTPINEVYSKAKSIMSFENEAWAEEQFSNTINFEEALRYLGIITQDSEIKLSIRKDVNSEQEQLYIKSMNESEIMNAKITSLIPNKTPEILIQGIYNARPLDENTYYIQYNSCEEDPQLSMENFVKQVEAEMKGNSYKKIIVDLRYNSGGKSSIFEPMIKSLQKGQKEQGFSVYTLIGRETFSSGIINAIQLQEQTNSIMVGSQTGGNVNCYGELKNFNLPNAPMAVWYSTKYFELIKGYDKDSLYPDISIPRSFENYMNGKDEGIQAILAL